MAHALVRLRQRRTGRAVIALVIVYLVAAPPLAWLAARERRRRRRRRQSPPRVAVVVDAIGGMHGVTRIIDELRARGVPGFSVEVIGTDENVDRRLAGAVEVEIPFYPGLRVGLPPLPELAETLADGYDLLHLLSAGPVCGLALLVGRSLGLPTLASYHTELDKYAGLRSQDPHLEQTVKVMLRSYYRSCKLVLSPSRAADRSLVELGVETGRIARWGRGTNLDLFRPERRGRTRLDGEVAILYAGRLSTEKGIDLLADAYLRARERDPRLHLSLCGGGPEEDAMRERLGDRATFLGWQRGEAYADVHAGADIFLFCSETETFGQVVLEAQASGTPVIAVACGGQLDLVEDGVTGVLVAPNADSVADAVLALANDPVRRRRIADAALAGARGRSWAEAFADLAAAYGRLQSDGQAGALKQRALRRSKAGVASTLPGPARR